MYSVKRLKRPAFVRDISRTRQPIRSFVVSKIVPVATGAALFGMGCMSKFCAQSLVPSSQSRTPTRKMGVTFELHRFYHFGLSEIMGR